MSNLRKAAEMALEALEMFCEHGAILRPIETKEELRQALSQPEQYDQTALELCEKCGWKAVIPDEGCLVCARGKQEPVAHLWECIGRWTAMIAHDGEDANLTPPDWLVDAVKAATAPPKQWVGLTDEEIDIVFDKHFDKYAERNEAWPLYERELEAKLKEKNT